MSSPAAREDAVEHWRSKAHDCVSGCPCSLEDTVENCISETPHDCMSEAGNTVDAMEPRDPNSCLPKVLLGFMKTIAIKR